MLENRSVHMHAHWTHWSICQCLLSGLSNTLVTQIHNIYVYINGPSACLSFFPEKGNQLSCIQLSLSLSWEKKEKKK